MPKEKASHTEDVAVPKDDAAAVENNESMLAKLTASVSELHKKLIRIEAEKDVVAMQFRSERERNSMLEKRLVEAKMSTIEVESQADPELAVELADKYPREHDGHVAKVLKYVGADGKMQQSAPHIDEDGLVHYLFPKFHAETVIKGRPDRFVLVSPAELKVRMNLRNEAVRTFKADPAIKNILRSR